MIYHTDVGKIDIYRQTTAVSNKLKTNHQDFFVRFLGKDRTVTLNDFEMSSLTGLVGSFNSKTMVKTRGLLTVL